MRDLLTREQYVELLNELGRELEENYEFEIDGIKKELDIKKLQKGSYNISYNGHYLGYIEKGGFERKSNWVFTGELKREDGKYMCPTVERRNMERTLKSIFCLELY